MAEKIKNDKEEIALKFQIKGEIKRIRNIGNGYINRTYLVETVDGKDKYRYVLQRVNTNVFEDFEGLMKNFEIVTEHLKDFKLEGSRGEAAVASLVKTKSGENYFIDNSGSWRVTTFF